MVEVGKLRINGRCGINPAWTRRGKRGLDTGEPTAWTRTGEAGSADSAERDLAIVPGGQGETGVGRLGAQIRAESRWSSQEQANEGTQIRGSIDALVRDLRS